MKAIVFQSTNQKGTYWTIMNEANCYHVHAKDVRTAKKILICVNDIEHHRPIKSPSHIRIRAMNLLIAGKPLG